MTDPFENEDEEWVEICDSTGKRSAMRHLATISLGGKTYFVLGALREDSAGESEEGLLLVREDHTVDGMQEYVIAEDESEIENVVGHFVSHAILHMIEQTVCEGISDEDCPCGARHRPGDFCYCDDPDYLQ